MNLEISRQVSRRMSEIIALFLWGRGAIKVSMGEPFRLVSGNFSPIYINCRQVISDPTFMHLFTAFARTIFAHENLRIDKVAGCETAGIPFAAYLAQDLAMPMVYIRKAAKEHGITNLVEGILSEGERVLIVDDVITDAGSKLTFVKAARNAGGIVHDVLVLFDREQKGSEALERYSIRLHSLTNISTVLRVVEEMGFLTQSELDLIKEYLRDPGQWHKQNNLPYKEAS